jgi:uncharacterized protein YndB with AHSA1/START domain
MVTYILAGVALVVVIALFAASRRPDTFRIARTVTIRAPAERIFPLIDEPRAHEQWSPFVRRDPHMKKAYVGPTRGVGATLDFDGGSKSGVGRLMVTGSEPAHRSTMRLQMTRPMACDNVVEFTLVPKAPGITDVTWAMSGGRPFVIKLMTLACDMDGMVARDFDDGLARLKGLVESDTIQAGSREGLGYVTGVNAA